MDPETAFLRAALPEPVTLLGQTLEPYSLGHELILRRFQSPFLDSADQSTILELIPKLFTAVFVCSQTYADALAGLKRRDLDVVFQTWRRKAGKLDAPAKIISFLQYLRDGRACPATRTVRQQTKGEPVGQPYLLMVLSTLTGHLGFSFSEAVNCPYGLAQYLFASYAETKGWLRFVSTADVDRWSAMRAAMREAGMEPLKVDPEARN